MNKKAFIVIGLGYGDEGKGSTVDFLTRKYASDLTIRFSGGSQCGHGVMDKYGNYHVFSQFGSGSLAGSRTLLGRNMFINPFDLKNEEKKLSNLIPNPLNNLFIDENATLITPYHRSVNRIIESHKGKNKNGSCGQGVWETKLDSLNNIDNSIKFKDFKDRKLIFEKLCNTKYRMLQKLNDLNIPDLENFPDYSFFDSKTIDLVELYFVLMDKINIISSKDALRLINKSNNPVFEGNQGIGIDENCGFFPYVTATDTTSNLALDLLDESNWCGDTEVIGVTRGYATRHGVGPFVTESKLLSSTLTDRHNCENLWQDHFRRGWLDLNLLRYSINVDGYIHSLAVSHLDEVENSIDRFKFCYYYKHDKTGEIWSLEKNEGINIKLQEQITNKMLESSPCLIEVKKEEILGLIENEFGKKIKIKSFGPRANEKLYLEN